MEANEALTLLGRYSLWHLFYFVSLSVGLMFPSCFQVLNYLFQAYTPAHHCMIDNTTDISSAIPWDNKTNAYSSCKVFVNNSAGNVTIEDCSDQVNQWFYYDTDVNYTIVSEYDLVCERDSLKRLTSTINSLGVVLGTFVFTPLHDNFGRRPMFLLNQYLMVCLGVWTAFTHNYIEYCVVRFLVGFVRPGFDLAAFVLACELFPADQRTFAGVIIETFWGVAICVLALLMYLIKNWRHLQIVLSLFGLVFVPYFWFLPESIPWLVSKGRLKEAEATIQSAARFNRLKNFPQNIFIQDSNTCSNGKENQEKDGAINDAQVKTKETEAKRECLKLSCGGKQQYSILDVLRHRRLRWFLFVTSFIWLINNTVYYGMTLNTESLAGDRYLNLFISGLVEIPAYLTTYFLIHSIVEMSLISSVDAKTDVKFDLIYAENDCNVLDRFGRRYPLVILHVIAGVFLIVSEFIPRNNGIDLVPLKITLVMLGKFGITATFAIIYLFTPELFPTIVRSQSMGVAVVIGRVGGLIAPFSSALNDIQPWLTAVVFGAVSIFGGLLALTLPETNRRPLPQTIEDIESWYKDKNSHSNSFNLSEKNSQSNSFNSSSEKFRYKTDMDNKSSCNAGFELEKNGTRKELDNKITDKNKY